VIRLIDTVCALPHTPIEKRYTPAINSRGPHVTTRPEPPRICQLCGSVAPARGMCPSCFHVLPDEEPLHRALPAGAPVYTPTDEGNAPD